jgi:protein arginine N-methyltransferase 1
MFSLAEFGRMIADRARLDAHAEALRRVVTPTSVVLDLGAGTGIMSLLACQAGARRVYAIEPSPMVHVLADAARDNGCAERVVVLERRSSDVTLPERADVIVSDLRGVLPPYGTHFADLVDARARLLAPGGRLLPARDTMWAAVASAPEAFEERHAVWRSAPHGLDLRATERFVDHVVEKHRAPPERLLTAPIPWASLDYATLVERAVRGSGLASVTRPGVGHGLVVWFDAELVEGVGYSNAPGAAGIYGQILFPWPEAVPLEVGDQVSFELRADPVGDDYVWTWTSAIERRGAGHASFRQSTFNGVPRGRESLRRRAATHAPALSASGADALAALEGIRAGSTVGEIAARLHAERPGRFASLEHAHGFVADLVERFGA